MLPSPHLAGSVQLWNKNEVRLHIQQGTETESDNRVMIDRNQQENRENYIMKIFIIFNLHQTSLRRSKQGAGDGMGM
jgi:hypothetical protein